MSDDKQLTSGEEAAAKCCFATHVRGVAFSLQLSRRMVDLLLWLDSGNGLKGDWHLTTGRCLEDRGLARWKRDSDGTGQGIFITEAGRKTADLLRLAGYEGEPQ